MEKLFSYIQDRISINEEDFGFVKKIFSPLQFSPKSIFIQEGSTTHSLYFLEEGIVRGFKNNNGKIIVEHLVEDNNFLTSTDSFFFDIPSNSCFETITDCSMYKVSKVDLNVLKESDKKWSYLIELITNESLHCKQERVLDFQTLTAKERYLKFIKKTPNLALNVSVETIASYLGMEPQSLSRIRSQVTI